MAQKTAAKKPARRKASPEKKTNQRKRNHLIAFWVTREEYVAFQAAELQLGQRTGKLRQRSEHLRNMIKKFVRDVKMSADFTE